MTVAKVIEAFLKYASDTDDTARQTATKIGVPLKTLRTWLEGQAQHTKRPIARLAGFLRRAGYLLSLLNTVFYLETAGASLGIFSSWSRHLKAIPHQTVTYPACPIASVDRLSAGDNAI
jgi:hypothetical protein